MHTIKKYATAANIEILTTRLVTTKIIQHLLKILLLIQEYGNVEKNHKILKTHIDIAKCYK